MALWPIAVTGVIVVSLVATPSSPFKAAPAALAAQRATITAPGAVEASVLAAEQGKPIPASLSPSFEELPHDFKGIGDCSGYDQTTSKICQFGDAAGAKRMVVFGNSHSTMWIPALSPIAKSAHWQFFPVVKEACGYNDYLANPATNSCAAWYAWAKQQIATIHPDLIVVSVYVLPGWQAAMPTIVNQLKALGTRVVLLSDAPGVDVAPVDCLLKNNATQKTCLWPEKPTDLAAEATAQDIAAKANIGFVDVTSWFCYEKMCPSVINSIVPYTDTGHMGSTYATYLVPALTPSLHLS
jgi:hypothetical protein